MTRRGIVTAGIGLFLSGCSGTRLTANFSPVFSNLGSAFSLALRGLPDATISPEYVAKLPYACIGAKIGRGQRSLLVLGRYDGEERHWISADRAVVVTRNGRVTRLFGVGSDLKETRDIEGDPVASATFNFDGRHSRSVDLVTNNQFGIPVESTFELLGRQTISVLETQHDTVAVVEHCSARTVRWNFENQFWFDFDNGYVWKSVQHFVPERDPIEIEVFKRDA